MLLRREVEIGSDETAVELTARLGEVGADLIVETIARLDEIEPTTQDHDAATYAPVLTREDGKIDWTLEAREIANRARGFQPWPGAWTTLAGARLHIWRADVENGTVEEPGTIVEAKGDRLSVAAGNGTILLAREVQLEGKRRMGARDLVNGTRIETGTQLGL